MDQTAQQTPQEQIVGQSPMVAKKSILFPVVIVGAIILLAGLVGGYMLAIKQTVIPSQSQQAVVENSTPTPIVTQVPLPTSSQTGMNMYTNTQLGIAFEYPSTWKTAYPFGVPPTSDSPSFIGLVPIGKESKDTATPIIVESYANPKNLPIQQFEDDWNKDKAMSLSLYSPTAQITKVGGVGAYYIERANCEPLICNKYIIMAKNKIFVFSNLQEPTEFSAAELEANKTIFNQIIDSVTFPQ